MWEDPGREPRAYPDYLVNMPTERLPCRKCDNTILPATAARTNGLCMPCWHYDDGNNYSLTVSSHGTALIGLIKMIHLHTDSSLLSAKTEVEGISEESPIRLEIRSKTMLQQFVAELVEKEYDFSVRRLDNKAPHTNEDQPLARLLLVGGL